MIIHEYPIEYKYGDTIKIKPLFDVHMGNKLCDVNALRKYLSNSDKQTYFFGGGDALDSITVTDPRYLKSIDGTTTNAIVDDQIDAFCKELEPYKKKIIGIGMGNHETKVLKKCGTNPTKRIAKRLGCVNLGYSGIIILKLHEKTGRGRKIKIRWHHGWGGGGRTLGGSITKYSKDSMYWDCDIFLYGHDHQLKSDTIPRLGVSGKSLIAKDINIGVCGTYLKTFVDSADPSYSEEGGYPPTRIGGLTIKIKPNFRWVDIKIET